MGNVISYNKRMDNQILNLVVENVEKPKQPSLIPEFWTEASRPIVGKEFLQYKVMGQLKVVSSEADLWLLQDKNNVIFLLKLYRAGVVPFTRTAGLSHPNVIKTLETGQLGDCFYEIQPYLEHGGFHTFIKPNSCPTWEQFKRVALQLTQGLEYLHNQGIQHRDIKPENIPVSKLKDGVPSEVIISDFGSSAQTNTTVLTGAKGTILYSAPEVLQGTTSRASDWYSLGLVLLTWYKGKHPLTGFSPQEQFFKLASGQLPIDAPESMQPLFKGLLEKEYGKRWGAQESKAFLNKLDEDPETVVPLKIENAPEYNYRTNQTIGTEVVEEKDESTSTAGNTQVASSSTWEKGNWLGPFLEYINWGKFRILDGCAFSGRHSCSRVPIASTFTKNSCK